MERCIHVGTLTYVFDLTRFFKIFFFYVGYIKDEQYSRTAAVAAHSEHTKTCMHVFMSVWVCVYGIWYERNEWKREISEDTGGGKCSVGRRMKENSVMVSSR